MEVFQATIKKSTNTKLYKAVKNYVSKKLRLYAYLLNTVKVMDIVNFQNQILTILH